jgi:ParB/RepB/Spo0J family partition protein
VSRKEAADRVPADNPRPKGRPRKPRPSGTAPPPLVGDIEVVRVADINPGDTAFQFRVSYGVTDLRRSLEQEGLRTPIDLVGPKPYRIVDGFRRCKAATALGWETLRAVVHTIDDKEALRVAFTKNVVRKALSPVDRANAVWLAQRQGFKRSELAELFSLSPKQLQRYLDLLSFSPALQKALDGQVLTMAHARHLHAFDASDPAEWKKRIESEGLSAKRLRKLLQQELGKQPAGRPRTYIKRSKDGLRFYPFVVSRGMALPEREKLGKALRDALAFLEEA